MGLGLRQAANIPAAKALVPAHAWELYKLWTCRDTQLLLHHYRKICEVHSRFFSFYIVPGKHQTVCVELSLRSYTPGEDYTPLHKSITVFSRAPSDVAQKC